jgi:hypothetical protein
MVCSTALQTSELWAQPNPQLKIYVTPAYVFLWALRRRGYVFRRRQNMSMLIEPFRAGLAASLGRLF